MSYVIQLTVDGETFYYGAKKGPRVGLYTEAHKGRMFSTVKGAEKTLALVSEYDPELVEIQGEADLKKEAAALVREMNKILWAMGEDAYYDEFRFRFGDNENWYSPRYTYRFLGWDWTCAGEGEEYIESSDLAEVVEYMRQHLAEMKAKELATV